MNELSKRLAALSPLQRELLAQRLKAGGPPENTNVATEVSRQLESHRAAAAEMQFSLLFFSDDGANTSRHKYRLILDSAKHADAHDFSAVWIPERHFQPFGGLYPNPSVLGAALATVTERIQIRAGSVALPLHNPIRVAEEWAMIDNLSDGRVGVSFASGWQPDDFVLSPAAYAERKELMFRQIKIVQRLWEGEAVRFSGVDGREVEVRTLPRPVQARLPVWITSSSSLKTWVKAGEIGAGMLVGLMGETFEGLSEKIGLYRESLARNGFDPRSRPVTVMLHTFVGEDLGTVKEQVRAPLTNYLRTFMKQTEHLREEVAGAGGRKAVEQDKDALASFAFERLFNTSSLLGTPETCRVLVERLAVLGVDEIACLVDFGLDAPTVLNGLFHLNELRQLLLAASPQESEIAIGSGQYHLR